MDDEIAKILLDRNLSFLEAVTSTTMTWWVSTIVFCPTVIALFWYYRDKIVILPKMNHVCFVVAVFLLSIPSYAAWVIVGLFHVEEETRNLLNYLDCAFETPFSFTGVKVAIFIGGSCFLFAFALWIYVWTDLNKLRKKTQLTSGSS